MRSSESARWARVIGYWLVPLRSLLVVRRRRDIPRLWRSPTNASVRSHKENLHAVPVVQCERECDEHAGAFIRKFEAT